jgi:HD-GYP domain-containing protein (c-di-GMP phosphodiesterase class II)
LEKSYETERTVILADLLFSVSEAMDLSDASLVDHQLRTAFVSSEMGRTAHLDYAQSERLFAAALLHDIGALSPEERIGAHVYEDLRPEPHCQRGGKLFEEAFWLASSKPIVDWHHTPMKSHQKAGREISDANVLASQIVFLADHLEHAIKRDTFILHETATLRSWIHGFANTAIHPDVIALFDTVSESEEFWLHLVAKDLGRMLRERSLLRSIELDYDAARSIASVFKDMTDFRSRFTASHSSGVSACARGIGQELGFTGKDLQQIDLAGLMHDIGKLVVPNTILCKTTALSPQEYEIVKQHPLYTHRILSRVKGFEHIAEWAGFHHERLDGSGYGCRMSHPDLDVGAKVVAVADVATAIAERRPYREPSSETAVLKELRKMTSNCLLEPKIVAALADNYSEIMPIVQEVQANDEIRFSQRYAMIP